MAAAAAAATAAVCNRTSTFESILMQSSNKDLESSFQKLISSIPAPLPLPKEEELPPGQFDVWSSIQAQKKPKQSIEENAYVHPMMRRSSSLLSQKSLEICTESLGSETGSDDYFSSDDEIDFFSGPIRREQQQQQPKQTEACRKQLTSVNYHCSIGRQSSLPRSFPPPLQSLSHRDGPCLQMRTHRRDGRLVMEAVSVPSQNYLHAERQNGRLLLSFVNSTATASSDNLTHNYYAEAVAKAEEQEQEHDIKQEEETEVEAEEEEEEQVEVVDRGTVVEVKVSTQPQQNSTIKVHRSSIVINKFVSCMTVATNNVVDENNYEAPPAIMKRTTNAKTTTTTAAAAAVAASSVSTTSAYEGGHSLTDNKLLFTSTRRNREELLRDMRRCSELRKPLFIWEPCCIATSS